jgi:hypothetical protein
MLTHNEALAYYHLLLHRWMATATRVTVCLAGGHLITGTLTEGAGVPGAWIITGRTAPPHSKQLETRFHVSQVVAVSVELP